MSRVIQQRIRDAVVAGGGPTALARVLGVKQSTVSQWIRRKRIPAEWVLRVEAETGIPRYELRPDIYPREERREMMPA